MAACPPYWNDFAYLSCVIPYLLPTLNKFELALKLPLNLALIMDQCVKRVSSASIFHLVT